MRGPGRTPAGVASPNPPRIRETLAVESRGSHNKTLSLACSLLRVLGGGGYKHIRRDPNSSSASQCWVRPGMGGRSLGPPLPWGEGERPSTAEGPTWGSVARPRPRPQRRRDLRGRGRPGGARGSPEDSRRGAGPHREGWERRAQRPPTPLPEAPPTHPAGPAPRPAIRGTCLGRGHAASKGQGSVESLALLEPCRGIPQGSTQGTGVTTLPFVPRSPWPALQASVTAPRFVPERAERLARPPTRDSRGILSPPPPTRDIKNMLTPVNLQCRGLRLPGAPPGAPPAPSCPPQKRHHRKQPHPCQGSEKGDPGFEGVTLKFQIKPDASLQILPSYSLACSSGSLGGPAAPTGVPEASQAGSEALGPRRCASCKTERTPLWRDAEDGTPLCNACGIRYKKYGTRCSGCWLVPRKSVQPKRLCGRCGVSLGPPQDAVEEGAPRGKTQASGPRAPQGEERALGPVSGAHRPPSPQPLLQPGLAGPPLRKCSLR
ncbi:GATA-type zinc finger protein 1 [Choloepus didactylus]|uniref:GATA-type zinc finger protein 1 n=1 Tax=Choloepus didactylus TaxID=27675 RepID=UPI00189DE22D|nr:GATA-type zinc finger protein 1 [Choloepus didactylus]